eukprot:scaffold50065_cov18-Tisochrysis_lutea.AAC.3
MQGTQQPALLFHMNAGHPAARHPAASVIIIHAYRGKKQPALLLYMNAGHPAATGIYGCWASALQRCASFSGS